MLENHLETMFRQSTGCEWKVTCPGCHQPHVMDERVIGPDSLICPHCQNPLDAQTGAWVPRNPNSTWGDGFTINHFMVPWLDFYAILDRQKTYDRARFVNEVLGRPTTLGDHIITREEAEACCEDRPFAASLHDVPAPGRGRLVAGIDWGGGSASGTVLVLGYLEQGRRFRVVRFDRWQPHEDPNLVLKQVAERCRQFHVQQIAVDGNGNGHVYNRRLSRTLEQGSQRPNVWAIYYATGPSQAPQRDGILWRWSIERSQVIGALFTRIKDKLLSFPRVAESGSFLDELTCELAEYDNEMRCVKYTKPENERDDALHAIVYAESLALRLAASMVG
jgi:hypothetical protein